MNRVLCALLAAMLITACSDEAPQPQLDPESQRSPVAGEVVGLLNEYNAHMWLGLPFAEPPVGEMRWRAPQTIAAWKGIREASEFGNSCTQPTSQFSDDDAQTELTGDEDCLYLNIYAPAMSAEQAQTANLPVMFWIHGGGNSIGSASDYDGSILATQENVIVITAQYRLGPFGWFYQPELASPDSSAEDISGNYGTLDLIEGLRWTRDNIRAFGGDPDNVTIFGESAGGFNVFSLLVSPLAKGLFQQAISQSGSTHFASIPAASKGVTNSSFPATSRMLSEFSLGNTPQLRELSNDQVMAVYRDGRIGGMIMMPTILHDGHVLPADSTLEALAAGNYNRVPAMMGTNKDEQKLFQYLDPNYADTWFGFWTHAIDPIVYDRDAWYQTRHWRLNGVEEPARKMTQSPVYAYRFDWDDHGSPLGMDFPQLFGAAHAFEIPFVFGGIGLGPLTDIIDTTPNQEERANLSNAMMRYWANFARSGNPNDSDLTEWQLWNEQEQFLVFDGSADGGIRMSTDTMSVAEFANALASDSRFEDQQSRCDIFNQLRTRSQLLEAYINQMDCE